MEPTLERGRRFESVSRTHPLPVVIESVGTNHVRFWYVAKTRRTDAGRLHKVRVEEFRLKFRPR